LWKEGPGQRVAELGDAGLGVLQRLRTMVDQGKMAVFDQPKLVGG